MPGKASLRAGEYYAHPRNHFWDFMEALLGIKRSSQYDERLAQLLSREVALWDVLKSCTRGSSLDSDIVPSSIVPNDFVRFFRTHPSIRVVCFNGAKASVLFQRHVHPRLSELSDVLFHKLPSTSPANASIPLDKKLEAWRVLASAV
jgi:double-stranded uracil-DNA glycosylase